MSIPAPLLPWVTQQFFDANGDPLAAGKVAFFVAGTSSPKSVFSDPDLAPEHAQTNPVILDANGRPPAPIFIQPGGYLVEVRSADDVLLWTCDDVEDVGATWLAQLGIVLSTGAAMVESGYQVTSSDNLVTVASTGGANPCLVVLESAAVRKLPLCVKNMGTIAVSIVPDGADTVDGQAGGVSLPAMAAGVCPSVLLVPDGVSNWTILASHAL